MDLSLRLNSLVKYVSENDIICDVGCDHAYLSIYLIKNKLVKKAYISDINEKALQNGINNLKKHNLTSQIEAKVSDGIKDISPDVNTLIISGMGANTILKILHSEKIKQINKIIIQSNNDYDLLRDNITKNGFYILGEDIVFENNKYYVNICFYKGYERYTPKEIKYGPYIIKNKESINYLQNLLMLENDIYSQVPRKKIKLKFIHKKEIKNITKIITKIHKNI